MLINPALSIVLIAVFTGQATAITNVQFFPATNCGLGSTSLPIYTSDQRAPENEDCKGAPGGTIAVWVKSLDAGCTVRTFSSYSCTNAMGSPIAPGICYFSPTSPNTIPILSWNIVCGGAQGSVGVSSSTSASGTASDELVLVDATIIVIPSGNASSTSLLLATTVAPQNSSISRITGTGTGATIGNCTEPATWSNTLVPGTSRTSEGVGLVTVDPIANNDGGRDANSGVGLITGNTAAGRSKGKARAAMLVLGSLFGLSWRLLW